MLKRLWAALKEFFDFDPYEGTRPGYDWCPNCGINLVDDPDHRSNMLCATYCLYCSNVAHKQE